jgi:hypothetical protein
MITIYQLQKEVPYYEDCFIFTYKQRKIAIKSSVSNQPFHLQKEEQT